MHSRIFKQLKFYSSILGWKIYIYLIIYFFVGVSEVFGIVMLLPLVDSIITQDFDIKSIPLLSLPFISSLPKSYFVILIILFFTLKAIFLFCALSYSSMLRAELMKKLRFRLLNAYETVKFEKFEEYDVGHYTSLMNDQVLRVQNAFHFFSQFISLTTLTIIYVFISSLIAPLTTLITFCFGISVLLAFKKLNVFVEKYSKSTASEMSKLSQQTIQLMNGYKYLKLTNQFPKLSKRLKSSVDNLSRLQIATSVAGAFSTSIREPIVLMFLLFLMYMSVSSSTSAGVVVVSIALYYRAFNSLVGLQHNWQSVIEFEGSLDIVEKALSEFKVFKEVLKGEVNCNVKSIEIKNLNFTFSNTSDSILKNVSLEIKGGNTTALIGRSGSGKSTIVNLLGGLYPPTSGKILFDGSEVHEREVYSFREHLGVVSQNYIIFDDTIIFNVTLTDTPTEEDKIKMYKALEIAGLDQFVNSLPLGCFTMVGDSGGKLSGGQRQRIAIARELFRSPSILILDEATSALDVDTEALIAKNLNEQDQIKTILIITHRIGIARHCDYVYEIEDGEIKNEASLISLLGDRID
jgi:ABC-type multidrug transport system fused ATPase/permease subunit